MLASLQSIAKKYRLDLVILFGSHGTKRERRESDVDIAVATKKDLTLSQELSLRKELSDIFGKEIDLVFIKRAGPLLLGQLTENGKLLYGDKKEFLKFKIYATKCYIDFEPYFKLQEKIIHRNLSKLHAR